MDVLIANPHGIFGVSGHRTVQEFSRFYAYGSGSDYALGALYSAYDDTGRDAEQLARHAVEAAAEFDDGTGLPITSFTVRLQRLVRESHAELRHRLRSQRGGAAQRGRPGQQGDQPTASTSRAPTRASSRPTRAHPVRRRRVQARPGLRRLDRQARQAQRRRARPGARASWKRSAATRSSRRSPCAPAWTRSSARRSSS